MLLNNHAHMDVSFSQEKDRGNEQKQYSKRNPQSNIEITKSNAITGYVHVSFPRAYDETSSVFVLVTNNVMMNGVEYGPFHQITCNVPNIQWREEPLSEEERNNGVIVQVRVIEFHS